MQAFTASTWSLFDPLYVPKVNFIYSPLASPPLIASARASKSIPTPSNAMHFAVVAYHSVSNLSSLRPAAACCKLRSVFISAVSARTAASRVSYLKRRHVHGWEVSEAGGFMGNACTVRDGQWKQ